MSVKSILVPVLVVMVVFIQCTKESLLPENKASKEKQELGLKAGELETVSNNLSFPVITTDGLTLVPVSESFKVTYNGENTGLTGAEIAYLDANGPWYAQKEETNKWQADYQASEDTVQVAYIDWGDVIESVNPKTNRPFRIELGLYAHATAKNKGYTMAVLANPSSSTEIQGTNKETFSSIWATVASPMAGLTVEKIDPAVDPKWNAEKKSWLSQTVSQSASQGARDFGFGLELNVAGKYIYGTTSGGWRPTVAGTYRITFYLSADSKINLRSAKIGNFVDYSSDFGAIETKGGEPQVDEVNNITYVDVKVVSETGGSGKGSGSGSGGSGNGSGGSVKGKGAPSNSGKVGMMGKKGGR